MISELDRYHGVVLRQLLTAYAKPVPLSVADTSGRVDTFAMGRAVFQIKHSTKRLSPWRFTYLPEHVVELKGLREAYSHVWVFLVCGQDGIVGLSIDEIESIIDLSGAAAGWLRVSRSRSAMYRVGGSVGDLHRAKPMGVDTFVAQVKQTE